MMQKLRSFDFILLVTPILLASFGLLMIYSASMVTAVVAGLESTHYLVRQAVSFGLGLVGFFLCSFFPYRHYQKIVKVLVLGSILLLIGVLLYGVAENNSVRSIHILGMNFQPAEFVKLVIIIYLASVYSKKQSYINDFSKGVLPPLMLTCIMLALIFFQPDIGTSAIVFLIATTIFLCSGIRMKHVLVLLAVGVTLLAVAIPSMVTEVRIGRFIGAYQPFTQPDGSGQHLIQSYLAIGGGGFTGEGLGQSIQKLGYLWGAHTDFIMAIIAEELGFIGVFIVIGLLSTIVLRGLYIARKCENSFGSLLAIGISAMIGIQSAINLGAISGLLPITGVPLPFLSYGGSSLLAMMVSMGILNNVAREVKKQDLRPVPVRTPENTEEQADDNRVWNRPSSQRGGRTWNM
ncbi:MAG TPA: FtsW/RodA/SpoVE family cell cycle protein [Bacillota bacterium]|nr:FtsW/RodA/SpoVE family cell cycle protein [Bacillota bacterium]